MIEAAPGTRRRTWLAPLAAAASVAAGTLVASAADAGPPAGGQGVFAPNRVVVRLAVSEEIDTVNETFGTETIDEIADTGTFLLGLPANANETALVQALSQMPFVDWAELNLPIATMGGTTGSFFVNGFADDYHGQYALGRIVVPTVAAERAVRVAMLDTGADATHEALVGRIVPGGIDVVDHDDDPSDTADGIDEDGDGRVDELVGHGTHLAGVVALVAPEAELLPIRVLSSDGTGRAFEAARGLRHAIEAGADVACLGFASSASPNVLAEAVAAASAAGIVVIAPAGNLDAEDPVQYPAGFPSTIAVAATDEDDVRTDFASYGAHVTIAAPGRAVYGPLPGDAYGRADGSSFSTALVAGAAALLLGADADADRAAVFAALCDGAEDIDDLNPDHAGLLGDGRVDVAAALALLDGPSSGCADPTGDGTVDFADVLAVIAAWGPCSGCAADVDGDGAVDFTDLLAVIAAWGGC